MSSDTGNDDNGSRNHREEELEVKVSRENYKQEIYRMTDGLFRGASDIRVSSHLPLYRTTLGHGCFNTLALLLINCLKPASVLRLRRSLTSERHLFVFVKALDLFTAQEAPLKTTPWYCN